MKTVEYLDACKAALGDADMSDYQLAKEIGVSRAAVSIYRNQGGTFSPVTAKKVAKILAVPVLKVRLDAEVERVERTKSPEERALYRELVAKMGAVLVFAGAGGLLFIAGARDVVAAVLSCNLPLCQIRRLFLGLLLIASRGIVRRRAAGHAAVALPLTLAISHRRPAL